MLAVELRFPTGRYHATAWGRHVNESEPEWPPSLYRLVRALYDAWKRKRPEWPEERVERVLAAVSSAPPCFWLPPATVAHTRSYLSQNTEDPSDRTKIFDAFVVVDRTAPVVIGWPEAELDATARKDLDELLGLLNYLGRSESWVEAALSDVGSYAWNCEPGSAMGEPVRVAAPVSPREYRSREMSWMDALTYSTGDLLKDRATHPPAMRYVTYGRAWDCFAMAPAPRRTPVREDVFGVLYAMEGKVMPAVTMTLEIAEQARRRLMGIHSKMAGGPERVSRVFSGKTATGAPLSGHRHAFFLPYDEDSDGKLDHLLVMVGEALDPLERRALDALESLYQRDGKPDVRLIPVRWRNLGERARVMSSAAPYVPSRHYRKGRGDLLEWAAGELRREIAMRGLPAPVEVEPVSRLWLKGGRSVRWLDFRRNRKEDPGRMGFGFRLVFAEPVNCPIAVGYGCHFGLGQFRRAE